MRRRRTVHARLRNGGRISLEVRGHHTRHHGAAQEIAVQALEEVVLPQHEIHGPDGAPVVVALGGISASRHVASGAHDPSPGWWEGVFGAGGHVDAAQHRVLGVDFLDGGEEPDGRPSRIISTHDQADALAGILDVLEVERIATLAGASYGGMVALAFAERYPERVARLVVIGAADRSDPMTTALRCVQRQVVELGLTAGCPRDALSIARQLAMTTYRSRREFAARFAAAPRGSAGSDARFPVEQYLQHHGDRFAAAWSPARFLALSLSADLHEVDPTRIATPTLLVAAEDDAVVPRAQVDALAAALAGPVRVAEIATDTGHDAFLTEPRQVGALLHAALHSPAFP